MLIITPYVSKDEVRNSSISRAIGVVEEDVLEQEIESRLEKAPITLRLPQEYSKSQTLETLVMFQSRRHTWRFLFFDFT